MPRGRPRKVIEEPREKTAQDIIASILYEYCAIPGCTIKRHQAEAVEIITALRDEGFVIVDATTKTT